MIARLIGLLTGLIAAGCLIYIHTHLDNFPQFTKALDDFFNTGRRAKSLRSIGTLLFYILPSIGCAFLIAPDLFSRFIPRKGLDVPRNGKYMGAAPFLIFGYIILILSTLFYIPALKDLFGD